MIFSLSSLSLQPVKSYPLDSSSDDETDGTYQFHRAIAQLMIEMVRDLSEAVVLPFDIELYASSLKAALTNLQKFHNHFLQANGASIRNYWLFFGLLYRQILDESIDISLCFSDFSFVIDIRSVFNLVNSFYLSFSEHLQKNVEKFTNLTNHFVHNTLIRLDRTK